MENVLIIGAHYDDAELGVGGTAAKLISKGKSVYKLTLTNNQTNFSQMNINVQSETSVIDSAKACKVLGVKEISSFQPVPCNYLRYSTELMQQVEAIIYDNNIDTVFFHFERDMNQDHIEASKICLTASRHCKSVFEYQSNGYVLDMAYYPTFFVDISEYVEKKKEALAQYGSEHNRFNRLFDTCIERNHIWGYACEVEYAEGFRVIKHLC